MDDRKLMMRVLSLAGRAKGMTSPNPLVGALLVSNGKVIAEDFHRKAGTPHAEALVLTAAGEMARGATLYVNLEPCCHTDKRTPPCTRKIIDAGVRRVVGAMKDPNPKVSGKGFEELRKAGVQVVSGVLEDRAGDLNEFYVKHITTGRPFVILKVAMTLDGKIATPAGESKWITGARSRAAVQRLRGSVDAVMTAIGTVKADNPRLTCRARRGRDPVRVIIDPGMETAVDMHVACSPPETIIAVRRQTLVSGGAAVQEKRSLLTENGVRIVECDGDRVDLGSLMADLGSEGITSVLVEGGSSLNASCLEAGIVDKVMFFIAPKIIGGRRSFTAVGGENFRRLTDAYQVRDVKVRRSGEDILVEGYIGD